MRENYKIISYVSKITSPTALSLSTTNEFVVQPDKRVMYDFVASEVLFCIVLQMRFIPL